MLATTLGGYSLLSRLGQGGTADVYLAVSSSATMAGFQKLLVIKHFRDQHDDGHAMFLDEVRLAARFSHPNVVQTNEVGTDGEQSFLVMEYIEGQPLESMLVRALQGGLERDRATLLLLFVLCEALAGLHYAHELRDYDDTPLKIVHRDISPHNIMITYEGQIKVVDFGIAKAQRRAEQTTDGTVKGKVRYMAPEQALGLAIDRRADIFSAGIVLYEIVSGNQLWGDLGDMQVFSRLLDGNYPQQVEHAPAALNRILQKALRRDAAQRYASAAELRRDLIAYLRSIGELDGLRDELALVMKKVFANERTLMNEIVRRKMASPDPHAMAEDLRSTRPDRTATTRVTPQLWRTLAAPPEATKVMVVSPPRTDETLAQLHRADTTDTYVAIAQLVQNRRRRWMLLITLGLLLVLTLFVLMYTMPGRG